jgi:hypothetical protein
MVKSTMSTKVTWLNPPRWPHEVKSTTWSWDCF